MTKELIPITTITIDKTETQGVDGRELHRGLESKQHYADWVKNRIERCDLVLTCPPERSPIVMLE